MVHIQNTPTFSTGSGKFNRPDKFRTQPGNFRIRHLKFKIWSDKLRAQPGKVRIRSDELRILSDNSRIWSEKIRIRLESSILGSEAGFRIRIYLTRIRIQHFRLNTVPDPGFWWPKIVKNFQLEKTNFFFGIKNYNLPIPMRLCHHKGCSSYRKSLQLAKETSSTSNHEIS